MLTLSFSFITQLFFFFLTALHDLKKKTVPLYIFLLAGAAGYILRMIDIFRGTAPQGSNSCCLFYQESLCTCFIVSSGVRSVPVMSCSHWWRASI